MPYATATAYRLHKNSMRRIAGRRNKIITLIAAKITGVHRNRPAVTRRAATAPYVDTQGKISTGKRA